MNEVVKNAIGSCPEIGSQHQLPTFLRFHHAKWGLLSVVALCSEYLPHTCLHRISSIIDLDTHP
jgi:hypothetical protein